MRASIYFVIFVFISNFTSAGANVTPINTLYYDPTKCGIPLNVLRSKRHLRKPYFQSKIMGGTNVDFGEHPWAVAIILDKNKFICTGTLISKKHVITAAHCFLRRESYATVNNCRPYDAIPEEEVIKRVRIFYGSNCLAKIDECTLSPKSRVMRIVRAQFGRFFRQNCHGGDIALLELEREIDEKVANYICLANRFVVPVEPHSVLALGWGENPQINKAGYMNKLQKLDFAEVFDYDFCKKSWNRIANDLICTAEVYNQNVCLGDSGGGIVTQLNDGRWLLLGVVSYGSDCQELLQGKAHPNYQTYTDVRMYSADIDKFTGFLLPWELI